MPSVFPHPGVPARADAPAPWRAAVRRDAAARAIIRNWRILTGGTNGEPTLIACSGGADSCALVTALGSLSTATDRFVVAHIIHDLRPEAEALADRDAAHRAAKHTGLPFIEARIRVRDSKKNLEAAAREARYAALANIARDHAIRHIATAHHADDQLETVVMSLLRGTAAGGAGVRGMPTKRRHGNVFLIRPMLTPNAEVDRTACRRICTLAGIDWREDTTNADTTRFRAAVRHRVLPILREIRPDVARRAMATAELAALAEKRLERSARRVVAKATCDDAAGEIVWLRQELRKRDALLLGAVLRLARRRVCGRTGQDRLSKRAVHAAVRAIRDRCTDPRRCVVGGIEIEVTARRVIMRAR